MSCIGSEQMNVAKAKLKLGALAVLVFAAMPATAFARHGDHPGNVLLNVLGAIGSQAREINQEALAVYDNVPRNGSCAERRERFRAILPDALRFGRYARDIYSANRAAEMDRSGLATLDLGEGRHAYYSKMGRRYAEAPVEPDHRQVVVIFQGTRLAVGSDISTDVLNLIGVETPYYAWAAALVDQVVREHPGMKVVVTGDSLGGGLALYAVLNNPGVSGFVFNPAGLSLRTWANANPAERERTNDAIIAIAVRDLFRIEPVTALSLAGRSVLPGHLFFVEAGTVLPQRLHSAETMVATLERAVSAKPDRIDCDANLGVLAH
jgi:pimeloyl-ACP methyl ester carboxylesterase